MPNLLTDRGEFHPPSGRIEGERLWLSSSDFEAATGWALKPEGLCKDEHCVPIPPGRESEFVNAGRIDAAAFWRHMERPLCRSADGSTWVLGEGARSRAESLRSLNAPDFSLPDMAGRVHSLSQQRGKKVFLVSWASW
jgi:hypothetical protein